VLQRPACALGDGSAPADYMSVSFAISLDLVFAIKNAEDLSS
jgi:hypothetical protein